MSMKFQQLQEAIQNVAEDIDKFYNKENKAAGTRIRKAMQDIKKLAQEIRIEVQSAKKKE